MDSRVLAVSSLDVVEHAPHELAKSAEIGRRFQDIVIGAIGLIDQTDVWSPTRVTRSLCIVLLSASGPALTGGDFKFTVRAKAERTWPRSITLQETVPFGVPDHRFDNVARSKPGPR